MSRSFGATSFTTRSPIRTWPAVISSRPATIRSEVVFPHPDGPTSTISAPSSTDRFRSETATVPSSNTFVTPSSTISAMASSALLERDRSEPDQGDVGPTGPLLDQHDGVRRPVRGERCPVPHPPVHHHAGTGGGAENPQALERRGAAGGPRRGGGAPGDPDPRA